MERIYFMLEIFDSKDGLSDLAIPYKEPCSLGNGCVLAWRLSSRESAVTKLTSTRERSFDTLKT